MGLSTTDLAKEGGSGLPKTIAPGNHTLKINRIELEPFKFIDGAMHLILHVETEPIAGFEGFMIDKDDESKGHYAGQIGRVKASQYVLIFLQNLCKALDINSWFVDQDNKHDSIEEFVEAFNSTAPYQDKYLEMCVAGKEYEGKSGYTNYDMWLPKGSKDVYAFVAKGGKVLPYNEADHLKKMEVKEVGSFGDDDLDIPKRASSDFSLD
jgi:hypothetical protein